MQIEVKKIATLTGHTGSVYALDKGVSESLIFSGSSDKFITQWNLETMQSEKLVANFPSAIYTICHIPEKKLLLVGTSAGSIYILDLEKKEEIKILQYHTAPVFDIKYSAITNCFYTAGGDGNFAVCSIDTLSLIKIKKLCADKVRSVTFNYNACEIAVASGDCNVRIFDLYTVEEKKTVLAHQLSANILRYSPDKKLILTGGRDACLNIWDAKNYTLIKSIPAHNYAIYDIAYSPDKTLFATASRDKTVKIWDAQTFELLVRINKENYDGHVNSVNKVFWSTYKNYLISTGDDKTIMVWDILLL